MEAIAIIGSLVALIIVRQRIRKDSQQTAPLPAQNPWSTEQLAERYQLGLYCREQFALDFTHAHLNHGSYGVVPKSVMRCKQQLYHEIETCPDLFFRYQALQRFKQAAQRFQKVVNAPSADSLVFTTNATTGINAVLKSLALQPGDAVLITNLTYNACKNAVKYWCEITGAEAVTAGFDTNALQTDQMILNTLSSAFARHQNIKVALLDHITSPTAVIFPAKQMCTLCRQHNVVSVIDAAHSCGQIPVDLADIDPDFYIFNLHKWCFAPKGVAMLYARNTLQKNVQSPIVSHFYKHPFTDRFFMQGTNDQTSYLATVESLRFMEQLGGFNVVMHYNHNLVSQAATMLSEAWGTELLVPLNMCGALACIRTPLEFRDLLHIEELSGNDAHLQGNETFCRVNEDPWFCENLTRFLFHHDGVMANFFIWEGQLWCRISAQVYNCIDDFMRLRDAVLKLRHRKSQTKQ